MQLPAQRKNRESECYYNMPIRVTAVEVRDATTDHSSNAVDNKIINGDYLILRKQ